MSSTKTAITVAIAENDKYQSDLLVHRLSRFGAIEIIFTACNGEEFLQELRNHQPRLPEIVLMDIQMPLLGGIETTNILSKTYPMVKVIAFSQWDNIERVASMILHGAVAFVSKTLPVSELVQLMIAVHEERHQLSDHPYALPVLEKIKEMREKGQLLSTRMQIVLTHVCNERSSKEIAELMELSLDSVKGYRKELFKLTGVKNVAGLVKYGLQHGYLTPKHNGKEG
ncbi:MAG: response regulator transcription factor [Bacteroidia bacterium]|nr:response regulator transcription factor [Bacteroidia bacterium]